MSKKQLLPPSSESRKREVSVNLRFSVDDHTRLKRIADFSGTTVASLLHYVTIHTALPLMEQEVRRAYAASHSVDDGYDADNTYGNVAYDVPNEEPA